MLGEVDRRPEIRRLVQPVDEAVDDRTGDQFEVADPRQNLRIDEPRARDGLAIRRAIVVGGDEAGPRRPTAAAWGR